MVQKITKRMRLDFSGLEEVKRKDRKAIKQAIKEEVGKTIVSDIKNFLGQSKSPVKKGKFKKRKKDGDLSILRDEGDLWASIEARPFRDGVDVGIWDQNEVPKADNHNKNSAASKGTAVPEREFIPKKGQEFRNEIKKKVNRIIREKAKLGGR